MVDPVIPMIAGLLLDICGAYLVVVPVFKKYTNLRLDNPSFRTLEYLIRDYSHSRNTNDGQVTQNIIESLEEISKDSKDMKKKFDELIHQHPKDKLNAKYGLVFLTCGFLLQMLANTLKV